MPTVTGTVEAISRKFGKFSILIDDNWYNTKEEWAPKPEPSKGDTVTFDNGGKNYIKKLKIVGAGSGSASSASTGSPKFNNIGVEVGHASNLAMRVVEQMGLEPASEAFYKAFTKETLNIYKLMQGIRKSVETGAASAVSLAAETEKPSPVTDEDVF